VVTAVVCKASIVQNEVGVETREALLHIVNAQESSQYNLHPDVVLCLSAEQQMYDPEALSDCCAAEIRITDEHSRCTSVTRSASKSAALASRFPPLALPPTAATTNPAIMPGSTRRLNDYPPL
jgi:hypothetical protein